MRFSLRQTTRQAWCDPSAGRTSVNWSGMPTGLVTFNAAPVPDRLRTVQSMAPPPFLPSKLDAGMQCGAHSCKRNTPKV
jgi:hypothetical protein